MHGPPDRLLLSFFSAVVLSWLGPASLCVHGLNLDRQRSRCWHRDLTRVAIFPIQQLLHATSTSIAHKRPGLRRMAAVCCVRLQLVCKPSTCFGITKCTGTLCMACADSSIIVGCGSSSRLQAGVSVLQQWLCRCLHGCFVCLFSSSFLSYYVCCMRAKAVGTHTSWKAFAARSTYYTANGQQLCGRLQARGVLCIVPSTSQRLGCRAVALGGLSIACQCPDRPSCPVPAAAMLLMLAMMSFPPHKLCCRKVLLRQSNASSS